MTTNNVPLLLSRSVVNVTVFATVSLRARLADPGLGMGQLTIEWE